jgi:hypothetical protein
MRQIAPIDMEVIRINNGHASCLPS